MTTEEKLVHFQQTAMESARAKSNSVIDDYKAGLEAIFQDFKEEKDRQAAIKIQAETDRLRVENNRQLRLEQLQIRKRLSDQAGALRERLFTEVSNMLEEYMKSSDYFDWMAAHILRAKEFAGADEVVVYIDPVDENLRVKLEEKTKVHLTISREAFFGGVRAVIPARHILIDDSFATKLKEEKEALHSGGTHHER